MAAFVQCEFTCGTAESHGTGANSASLKTVLACALADFVQKTLQINEFKGKVLK